LEADVRSEPRRVAGPGTRVLVVEDDAATRALVARGLEQAGYVVAAAADGRQALDLMASTDPALILLDLGLPDTDGFAVCRHIRRESRVPVVLLTARGAEEDVLRGFAMGADDYITKPFSPRVLVARVAGILRRVAERDRYERDSRLRIGGLMIDLEGHELRVGELAARLTPLEARLVHVLAANAGRIVPHGSLIEHGWRGEPAARSNLKIRIYSLRRKLEGLVPGGVTIRAVSGTGYQLVARPHADGAGLGST
jgi:DNA-binding response OmpR family regulator